MKKSKLKKALATAGVLSVALLSGVTLASCDDGGDSGVSEVDLTVTKAEAITSVSSYKDKGNYRDTQKTEIDNIVKDAEAKINAATSKESIDSIVSEAKSKLDAVKTSADLDKEENEAAVKEAKDAKIASINTLYATYKEADYRTAEWQALTKLVNDAKAEVNAMNNTTNINAYSTDALKTKLDGVKTNATLTAEELTAAKDAKLKAIDDVAAKYPEENYRTEQKTDRATAISEAKATVNGYTVIADVNAYTTTELENKLKALKTDAAYTAEELAAAKTSKKAEIDAVLTTYNENDYSSANWTIITNYISAAKAAVDALTTKDAVTGYDLTTLKAKVADVKTKAQEASDLANAKEAKINEVTAFMANYNESDYSVSNWAKIQGYKSTVSSDINALTTVNDVTSYSLETFRANVKAVQTKAQELKAAKDAKLAEIATVANKYPEANYRADEKQTRATAIKTAEDAVNDCTTVDAVNAISTTELENALKALKTDAAYTAEELQAAKDAMLSQINTLENGYKENDYSASNWKTLSGYITKAKADVNALTTKAAVEAYDIATLTKNVAAVPTLAQELAEAKAAKIKEIETLVATYASNKYSEANKSSFNSAVNSAKETVNGYTDVADVTAYAVSTLKTTLDDISTAVAGINTTYYDTLQAAITGAGDTESTVVLYADVEEDITVAKTQTIVLDLNSHTITNVNTHTITNSGKLTINDVENGNGCVNSYVNGKATLFNDHGTVIINGGTFDRPDENGSSNTYYTILNHGTMTINDGYINNYGTYSSLIRTGYSNIDNESDKSECKITVNGGTFVGGMWCIKVDDNGFGYINGGTFKQPDTNTGGYILNNNYVELDGVTLSGLDRDKQSLVTCEYYNNTYNIGKCVIKNSILNGRLQTTNKASGNAQFVIDEASSNKNILWVTYAYNEEQLNIALDDAKTLAWVFLSADITADVNVSSNQTVWIDLNSYTLTNKTTHTITNKGTLKIYDNSKAKTGTIDNVTHQCAALYNTGNVTIESGTLERSKEAGSSTTSSGGNSWYTIQNLGTMTINDGTVKNNGVFSSMIVSGYWDASKVTNPTECKLMINGGTFNGGLWNVKVDDYGSVVINGGSYEVADNASGYIMNNNLLEINNITLTRTGKTLINTWVASNNEYNQGITKIGNDVSLTGDLVSDYCDADSNVGTYEFKSDTVVSGKLYAYAETADQLESILSQITHFTDALIKLYDNIEIDSLSSNTPITINCNEHNLTINGVVVTKDTTIENITFTNVGGD